ncbi:reverse transcriptase domain-containing protein [Bradyrhizobium japonicum]|uniref:reverse transcriptase domain-containing protein n=1 Tax=Bradyrhizobium japonicum TaxID=375 RepID=UPI00339B94DA
MYVNYQLKYETRGRHVFVPTDECRAYGERLLNECLQHVDLPDYHFHYTPGGHVAALHRHIQNQFFFRIDVRRFFYSISRNRVAAALRHFGIPDPRGRAKWSCVANPYGPGYVLPIGFVQSPMLASMVVLRSPITAAINNARDRGAFVSMYFDDFIGSASNLTLLREVYDRFLYACEQAALPINDAKVVEPGPSAIAFNCDLREGFSAVTDERVAKFYSQPRSAASAESFESYRERVSSRNVL